MASHDRNREAALTAALERAVACHHAKRYAEAEELYRQVLSARPDHPDALHLFGLLCYEGKFLPQAEELIRRALRLRPKEALFHGNLGTVLHDAEKHEEAERELREALRLDPACPGAWYNLGRTLADGQRYAEAEAAYGEALRRDPADAVTMNNLANLHYRSKRFDESIALFRRALELRPGYGEARANLANTLFHRGDYRESIAEAETAIRGQPDLVHAHLALGNGWSALEEFMKAFEAYNAAIRLRPDESEAYRYMIMLLMNNYEYAAATDAIRKLLRLIPDDLFSRAFLFHARHQICDWEGVVEESRRTEADLAEKKPGITPFLNLCFGLSSEVLLACTRRFVAENFGAFGVHARHAGEPAARAGRRRLRLGFVTNDLRQHVVAFLINDLIRQLDRSRFEVVAYSFGKNDGSEAGARVRAAFDRVEEVLDLSCEQTAEKIGADGIDILIDLKGYTSGCRTQIFLSHPAPIQIRWVGHAGTTALECYDYLLVDSYAVPLAQQPHYTERLVHLPDAYQVCGREAPPRELSREECGLPPEALVFCCFNAPYKITVDVWEAWMRVMRQVPDSVLWLLQMNPKVPENLAREAEKRGIDPSRVIVAPFLRPQSLHLARYQHADLFLDTRIVSACATSADSLWGGCPLVTCVGEGYASRAAGSMLRAAGLPELITETMEDYEALILSLARDRERLKAYRRKLEAERERLPLFDVGRFALHFQAALEHMWKRWRDGLPPIAFAVEPDGATRDYPGTTWAEMPPAFPPELVGQRGD